MECIVFIPRFIASKCISRIVQRWKGKNQDIWVEGKRNGGHQTGTSSGNLDVTPDWVSIYCSWAGPICSVFEHGIYWDTGFCWFGVRASDRILSKRDPCTGVRHPVFIIRSWPQWRGNCTCYRCIICNTRKQPWATIWLAVGQWKASSKWAHWQWVPEQTHCKVFRCQKKIRFPLIYQLACSFFLNMNGT